MYEGRRGGKEEGGGLLKQGDCSGVHALVAREKAVPIPSHGRSRDMTKSLTATPHLLPSSSTLPHPGLCATV